MAEIQDESHEMPEPAQEAPPQDTQILQVKEEKPEKKIEIRECEKPEPVEPKKRGRPPGSKTKPKVIFQPVEIVKPPAPPPRQTERIVVRAPTQDEINSYIIRSQDQRRQQFLTDLHRRIRTTKGV